MRYLNITTILIKRYMELKDSAWILNFMVIDSSMSELQDSICTARLGMPCLFQVKQIVLRDHCLLGQCVG